MALNLANLLADFNGTGFVQPGTGEWGFIPDNWRLALPVVANPNAGQPGQPPAIVPLHYAAPVNLVIGTDPVPAVDANGNPNDFVQSFLKANYNMIVQNGVGPETALLGAMMRLRIYQEGAVTTDLAQRGVIEDEYVYSQHAGANWAAPGNNIPAIGASREIAKFAKRYTDALVSMMVYVFAARGHHWSPEYNDLYNRLKTACFIPTNPGFQLPTNEELFRLIIHCFGIRPLVALVTAKVANNELPAAMQIRFVPHAPIAGVAHITTGQAILIEMSTEPWWPVFLQKFQGAINAIDAQVQLIAATPYEFHVAAKVFGHNVRLFVQPAAEAAFKVLSQFLVGYVDHLGRKHSLAGQVAVTRKSGGVGSLGAAFSRMCDRFAAPDTNVANMTEFLAAV